MKKFSKMTMKQLEREIYRLRDAEDKIKSDHQTAHVEWCDRNNKELRARNYKSADLYIKIAKRVGWEADYFRVNESTGSQINCPSQDNSVQLCCTKDTLTNFLLVDLVALRQTSKIVFSVPCDPTYLLAWILPLNYPLS